jgi:hypothetical protein
MFDKPDDQAGQPAPLPPDGIARGRIDNLDDGDAFIFHAVPGYLYAFRPAADSPVSPLLRVEDENGMPLVSRLIPLPQWTFTLTSFSSILWSPTQEGTYRLGVADDPDNFYGQPRPIGEYHITVDAVPFPSTPDTSAPLITPGESPVPNPSFANPQWFQFRAVQGALYSFSTSNHLRDHQLIQIISPDGAELADNNHGPFSSFDWLARSSGPFYIHVPSVDDTPYTLIMTRCLNDQPNGPEDVALPAHIHGSIDYNTRFVPSDQDVFRFHAVADRAYVVVDEDDDTSVFLNLLDQDHKPLLDDTDYNWGGATRWVAPYTGDYYLSISGHAFMRYHFTGPYSVFLAEAPPEEQVDEPVILKSGEKITGQMHYRFDSHEFRFKITQRQTYRFSGQLAPGA